MKLFCNENLILRWKEETYANPLASMGKRRGILTPLARSSTIFDKHGSVDEEAMDKERDES